MLFHIEQKADWDKNISDDKSFWYCSEKSFNAKIRQGLESLIDYKGSRASNIDLERIC